MIFGDEEASRAFTQRNEVFFRLFENLLIVFRYTLIRSLEDASVADRIVFFLGRLCWEDFQEIILLAANGSGFGALKLVRGMYERAVVASFLSAHGNEAENFVDYSRVEQWKAVRAWAEAFPSDERAIELLELSRARYDEVSDKFKGKQSWSGLDFVTLAKSTGSLGKMLGEAYYVPLAHAHGTAFTLGSRISHSNERGFEFDPGPQPSQADEALRLAHKIMLYVLGTQLDHFWPNEANEALVLCLSDYVEIWSHQAQ